MPMRMLHLILCMHAGCMYVAAAAARLAPREDHPLAEQALLE